MVDLKEHFYYDETSATCLRWAHDVYVGPMGLSLTKKKDSVAGCLAFDVDRVPTNSRVSINKIHFRVHRVIWEMFNGPIPKGYVIDHLDGNPHNNKISNLACKTQRQNAQNRSKQSNNTSGITGVRRVQPKSSDGWYWKATVKVNNKEKSKSFSVAKYGENNARELAQKWREEQIKILNKSGQSYTERNGK